MNRRGSDQYAAQLLDVHVTEGKHPILRGVSLSVEPGERLLVEGPSGSGKSTILRTMAGIVIATSGEVHLFGTDISTLPPNQLQALIRENVGIGFQTPNLDRGLTVYENIVSLNETTRSSRHSSRRLAELALQFGIESKLDQQAHTLSGGEQQRVAMTRLLLPEPKLIILDEPTAPLDTDGPYGKENTYRVVRKFAEQSGATVVVVSHDREALDFATRIVHVRDGMVYDHNQGDQESS
ncbi:MAG TPA: ATP-binding cassette domain-containing protein [Patescibacteria group bacterium]|jgi:ABC-type lipoprotein export system ATPase subunit|nr:ATP-binding cassette domain-containing protein [Patescibacteria group bacterium]